MALEDNTANTEEKDGWAAEGELARAWQAAQPALCGDAQSGKSMSLTGSRDTYPDAPEGVRALNPAPRTLNPAP